jgi:glutamate-5-semialdehyde dehydrogenase
MTRVCNIKEMGIRAKQIVAQMAKATSLQKNRALEFLSHLLISEQEAILKANHSDLAVAKESGMNEAMLDRLSLEGRLAGIAADVQQVIKLPDPVREVIEDRILPNGLRLCKKRTPIGVLGIIYEARPNVTVDVSALTIKTGNCVILRGGSETVSSNAALLKVVHKALKQAELPMDAVQLVTDPDRKRVTELLKLHESIDLIIPRGGANLHRFCRENSTIPVITGGIGICHLFVDESANIEKSLDVVYNAKTQRPTVCNALDTLLVHQSIAKTLIPLVIAKLAPAGVTFKLDERASSYLNNEFQSKVGNADSRDWDTEWLSLVLGIKVVDGLDEAIAHIKDHSTGHSDGILTESLSNADRFTDEVDSAAVYVNASTRFTDGSQMGLGAEVAISTQKLHARGPMGLQELTSYKWVVKGDYHVRK